MDPASGTIASIGLTTSLKTLLGLVIESSETPYNLQGKFRQAPKSILRLQQDLRNFEALLSKIQTRFQEHGGIDLPQGSRVS